MRAIDTNVLVRLITRDNAAQAGQAASFVEKGACVSVLALAEAMWVLRTENHVREPSEGYNHEVALESVSFIGQLLDCVAK
jgi:predicted nucleic-acid-binding protein